MVPDLINGLFEIFGAAFVSLNIKKTYQDKEVKGVSILAVLFFTAWGFWNLYYYPHLNQIWSFTGGIGVVTTNSIWILQMLYYRGRKCNLNQQ